MHFLLLEHRAGRAPADTPVPEAAMPSYEVDVEGRRFRVWYSSWTGRETVHLGDALVSERRNLFGPVTSHSFTVQTPAGEERYELRNAEPFGHLVRRNGATVVERHHPVIRYLIAVGAVAGLLLAIGVPMLALGVTTDLAVLLLTWAPSIGILGGLPVAWWLKRRLLAGDSAAAPLNVERVGG